MRRTLGQNRKALFYAEGVTQRNVGIDMFNSFGVTIRYLITNPGCAARKLAATLGYGVERLRRSSCKHLHNAAEGEGSLSATGDES
jgi:hypothetical protein